MVSWMVQNGSYELSMTHCEYNGYDGCQNIERAVDRESFPVLLSMAHPAMRTVSRFKYSHVTRALSERVQMGP